MSPKVKRLSLLVATSPLAILPVSSWLATQPFRLWDYFLLDVIVVFAATGALLTLPIVGAIYLAFALSGKWDASGQRVRLYVHAALLLVVCTFLPTRVLWPLRRLGLDAFSRRSQELVTAISTYERVNGRPPAALAELVPKYLPSIPWTGMSRYPDYEYRCDSSTPKEYGGNPWVLLVETTVGFMNFDQMLYFPKQNYPEYGYGGSLERIGNWAYVHE
ncbi:MAG: hypothetical protein K1X74_10260 [Pirellulales bacterium]|nr:hypothetical protein [Pirellulales bacterium]